MIMKNAKLLIFLLVFAVVSCKTYNFTTNVLVPADITLPQHIEKIGIMNRSLPEKSNLFNNILEGFISGESIVADREATLYGLRNCVSTLNNNPRFKATSLEGEDYRGTGTKKFPIPLDWTEVDKLCKKYSVDAIASLETFDSDIMLLPGTVQRTRKNKEGAEEKYTVYTAELRIRVNAGWRVYDNANKQMVDEQVFYDEKAWNSEGISPDDALRKLPNKRAAINDAAAYAGQMFAYRISPKWLSVSRYIYTKPKKEEAFVKGKELVETNQWKAAAEKWSPVSNNSDEKIAGRACHNMAVAAEMEGNLESAIQWADKAYKEKGLKRISTYLNELNRRKMDQVKLDEQMKGK
jgi:hypothetical protein